MVLAAYRSVLAVRPFRRLVVASGVSDLGDGMGLVVVPLIALAVGESSGVVVGATLAAYSRPGVVGVLVFGRWLRRLPAASVLAADCFLRGSMLGVVALLSAFEVLTPVLLIGLLGLSSVLHAWGAAGKFTLVASDLPVPSRLTGNALVTSLSSFSIVVGPAVAGLLTQVVSLAWLVAFDALTFMLLGLVAWGRRRLPASVPGRDAPGGLRLIAAAPTLVGCW